MSSNAHEISMNTHIVARCGTWKKAVKLSNPLDSVCRIGIKNGNAGPPVSSARKFMFQSSMPRRLSGLAEVCFATMRWGARWLMLMSSFAANVWTCEAANSPSQTLAPSAEVQSHRLVTSAGQFRMLTGADYLDGCNFELSGVVTLVDPGRDLVVLQDASGAVALHFPIQAAGLRVGQRVLLQGTNCCPYVARFPDYPYWPTLREIRDSFEAPSGCGNYYLTRMRGYLHPTITGEYSFWIASDNSSELWLSTDNNPSKARKIAFIPRFNWVAPREWSRFPSQHSETIWLQAGESYYIEALQEQTTVGDNLSVAWQGPGMEQAVIDGRFLTPCGRGPADLATNGILREFWTNYLAGDLADVGGARPFQSVLSVESIGARVLGRGPLPQAEPFVLGQPWPADKNYHWMTTEGSVKFVGSREDAVWFELAGEQAQVQVRAPRLETSFLRRMQNARVRVEGVCEGLYDKNKNLVPGVVWIPGESSIHFMESTGTNSETAAVEHADTASTTDANPAMLGFYTLLGIVTFNDRVFDKDYTVVQEEESAVLVSGGETSPFQKQLKVGEWVELGGALQPGKFLPVLAPLVITELGWLSMPAPITEPLDIPVPANRAGRWSELAGVVHAVNTNGTLSIVGKDGLVYFWVGQTQATTLAGYIDAKLRARGVLSPEMPDAPLLLVPSPDYLDVEEPAPEKPFEAPNRPIAQLISDVTESWRSHRVKVAGEITYRDAHSFFVQDESGGIRVQSAVPAAVKVGDAIEVLAFPTMNATARILADAEVRPARRSSQATPKVLNVGEGISPKQNGTLVQLTATLLGRNNIETSQVLELQEQQRVFAATLPKSAGGLPDIAAGSRVQVTGVYDNETTTALAAGAPPKAQFSASLIILLRGPADVKVLTGPPWWTWKRTATLVGTLLTVIAIAVLWIHLLQRRLERQHAAQLAFSRQVLERLEDERRRIAVNLHDSLGQVLLAIKNHALLAIQRPPDEQGTRQRFDEISSATSQAIEEVRQITHGLRPYQLDRLGLTQAIRASVNRASANDAILFASRVENIDGLFDKDAEIHVYRIVQEAVTNVVKHSGATETTVVIKKRDDAVSLSIRDNGCGFDPARLSSQPHDLGYGLSGIAERVRILGGTLAIDSRPGQGTSLTVEVPLLNHKHETGSNRADRG